VAAIGAADIGTQQSFLLGSGQTSKMLVLQVIGSKPAAESAAAAVTPRSFTKINEHSPWPPQCAACMPPHYPVCSYLNHPAHHLKHLSRPPHASCASSTALQAYNACFGGVGVDYPVNRRSTRSQLTLDSSLRHSRASLLSSLQSPKPPTAPPTAHQLLFWARLLHFRCTGSAFNIQAQHNKLPNAHPGLLDTPLARLLTIFTVVASATHHITRST
jgi:hypothetical protein